MATRKENIDIEYNEPQQEVVSGAAESNGPYESQDPADWVPPMTVRIYPISKPRASLSRGSASTTPRMACSSRNPSAATSKTVRR